MHAGITALELALLYAFDELENCSDYSLKLLSLDRVDECHGFFIGTGRCRESHAVQPPLGENRL